MVWVAPTTNWHAFVKAPVPSAALFKPFLTGGNRPRSAARTSTVTKPDERKKLTLCMFSSRWWSSGERRANFRTPRLSTNGNCAAKRNGGNPLLRDDRVRTLDWIAQDPPSAEVVPAAQVSGALRSNKVTVLAVDDACGRVWLGYFLRDRSLAVRQPSIAFAGYSARDPSRAGQYPTLLRFSRSVSGRRGRISG
jgi:hypothetical protein